MVSASSSTSKHEPSRMSLPRRGSSGSLASSSPGEIQGVITSQLDEWASSAPSGVGVSSSLLTTYYLLLTERREVFVLGERAQPLQRLYRREHLVSIAIVSIATVRIATAVSIATVSIAIESIAIVSIATVGVSIVSIAARAPPRLRVARAARRRLGPRGPAGGAPWLGLGLGLG